MSTSELRRVLACATGVVIGLGLASEIAYAISHGDLVSGAASLFSLSAESNVPTWYASSLLLVCSLALGATARTARARDGELAVYWYGLCALFAYMSLDEAIEIHERLGGLVGTGGVLYFDWVIPASVAVVVVAAIYVPFLRRLPPSTRRRFVVAGAVYVAGALVMELPLGWWTERAGDDNLIYALIDFAEESMELIGASLFLVAIRQHGECPADPTS